MSECPGPDCDRPAPRDATICTACTSQLERDLGDVPAAVEDLTTTLSRQDRLGSGGGGKPTKASEVPLPYHAGASEVLWDLTDTLRGWAIEVGALNAIGASPVSLSAFLLRNLSALRAHEHAGKAADEIGHAVKRSAWIVDRRPERFYAGPCDGDGVYCEGELYATPGAVVVDCPVCGLGYDLAERRDWLLDAVEDQLVGASVLAAAVTTLSGEPVTADRIRQWAHRGRIVARSEVVEDGKRRPLYRVGDVLDVLHGQKARDAS